MLAHEPCYLGTLDHFPYFLESSKHGNLTATVNFTYWSNSWKGAPSKSIIDTDEIYFQYLEGTHDAKP